MKAPQLRIKKPTPSKNQGVEQWRGNAYSTNNKNDAAIFYGGHRRENLFDICPIPKIKDTSQHRLSLELYKKLKRIVPAHNKGMPQKNSKGKRDWKSWHKAFYQLLEDSNRTEQDVSKVIQYYGEHIRDKFIPKLYSAITFCKEIHRVEQLMEDSQQDKPLSLSAQLKKAFTIARNRQVYKWIDKEGRRFIMWPSGEWRELGKNAVLGGNIFQEGSR